MGLHPLAPLPAPGDAWAGGLVVRVDEALGFAVVATADPRFAPRALARADVRYVEPDEARLAAMGDLAAASAWTPDDPLYPLQSGPAQVGAPALWGKSTTAAGASVCVLDTGVRATHEDLAARWRGGHDFVNHDADPADDHGHGTHVAGIAAAGVSNGVGVAGMANVDLYGVKVLGADGRGSWSALASGMAWCADHAGPRAVLVASLGGTTFSQAGQDAVDYARSRGHLVVAASGNLGPCADCVAYPAAMPGALAVGCTTAARAACSFGSTGPALGLVAPGVSILSTERASDAAYGNRSGTSMSAPFVAGGAALAWSLRPNLTSEDLSDALLHAARDLGPAGFDATFGCGELDLAALVAGTGRCPPPAPDVFWAWVDSPLEVKLQWTPRPKGSPGVDGLRLHRAPSCGGPFAPHAELPANATGHVDRAVSGGTEYCYLLRAFDGVGEGPSTAPAAAQALGPPSAPRDFVARPEPATPGAFRLSWTPPENNGGRGLSGYVLYVKADGGWQEVARPSEFSEGTRDVRFTLVGAGLLGSYEYRLTASNAFGEGEPAEACARPAPLGLVERLPCGGLL